MSKYLNNDKFPIKLFNQYDLIPFHSFKSIIDFYKNELRTSRFRYQNLLKEENSVKFLTSVLDFFPFIFFVGSKNIENTYTKHKLETNPIVKDSKKLENLFFKRVDLKKIHEQLIFISNQKDCKVNYDQIVNQLFRYLYKYSFYQIADSIYIDEQKQYCISNYINDYNKFKNEINSPNNIYLESQFFKSESQEFFQSFITEFENSISNDSEIVQSTITELEIVGVNSNFLKLLYSIIDNNIQFPSYLTSSKKNKFFRPLFHEIICNFSDRDWFELTIDDKKLIEVQRNFLRDYNNYF